MWLLIFIEYFKVTSKWSLFANFAMSLLVCYGIFCVPATGSLVKFIEQFVNNSTSVLSLLVGFTVAMFTLLVTASNPNIDEIKTTNTEFKLYKKPVSIFKMLLIRTVYIILIESILLLFNLLYPFFFTPCSALGQAFFGVDAFLLTHVIFANIGNIVNLYFILTKKDG